MPGLMAPPGACEVVSAVFGAPDGVREDLPPAATPLQQEVYTVDGHKPRTGEKHKIFAVQQQPCESSASLLKFADFLAR